MDLNYDNIQYSMGVANIMNKYNLSSTSDIKKYKNKNVSIKTKKKRDAKGVYNETLIFVQKKEAKRTLEFMKQKKEMLSSLATAEVQPTLFLLEDIEQVDVGEKI
jgi:murein L,D-transpeptidase YafK